MRGKAIRPFQVRPEEIGDRLEVKAQSSVANVTRHRDARLDALKGVAIALVVFGHALSYQIGSPAERTPLGIAIWSVHMPLFALVSGLVTRGVERAPGRFVVRRARQLLVPYLCWTALWGLVSLPDLSAVVHSERSALLFPRTSLWFLYTLFLCCLLLAATAPFGKRYVIAAALLLPLTQGLPIRPELFGLYDLVVLFPYFAVGYLFGQWRVRVDRVRMVPVVVAAILYAGMYWMQTTPGWPSAPAWYLALREVMHGIGLPGAVALLMYSNFLWGAAGVSFIYLTSPAIKGRFEGLLALLGRNTLGIYAMQAWALQLIARTGIRAAVPLTVLALFATALASLALARVPYVRGLLLGTVRDRRGAEGGGIPRVQTALEETQ